jgi:hypothetical protein
MQSSCANYAASPCLVHIWVRRSPTSPWDSGPGDGEYRARASWEWITKLVRVQRKVYLLYKVK